MSSLVKYFLIFLFFSFNLQANELQKNFFKAIKTGDTLKAKNFLEKGAKINSPDTFGLLPIGFDKYNFLGKYTGLTWSKPKAIHFAAISRNYPLVELLIEKGADLDAVDKSRQTALHKLANYHFVQGYNPILNLLVQSGANINAVDDYRNTPLHYAVKNDNRQAIVILLKKGASQQYINKDGKRAFDYASSKELKQLLRKKF